MRRALLSAISCLLLVGALSTAQRKPSRAVLVQPFLGAKYSQWLIGPISMIATDEEMDAYLALREDDQAEKFIEEFWRQRDPDPSVPGNPARQLFEQRAVEADDEYSEAQVRGRYTDRGAIYIIFGPPEETEYEEFRNVDEPDIEAWIYPKKAPPGLNGETPKKRYRFARDGDLTTFYTQDRRDDMRRRIDNRRLPGDER